jgi:hypothetical protein
MAINGGATNANAATSRILTQTILKEAKLRKDQPSIAELLAVYMGALLFMSSVNTPFGQYWEELPPAYSNGSLQKPMNETFQTSMRSQEYTSGYASKPQGVWYLVLGIVFLLNILCWVYIFFEFRKPQTDITEIQNIFTLAINSPPSLQFKDNTGHGPRRRDYVVPWRVRHVVNRRHYFFEEANDRPWKGRFSAQGKHANAGNERTRDRFLHSSESV